MDYGSAANCVVGSNSLCDMGQSAIAASESLHNYWHVPYPRIGEDTTNRY